MERPGQGVLPVRRGGDDLVALAQAGQQQPGDRSTLRDAYTLTTGGTLRRWSCGG
ncbi:hypothetical protein [Streptomyces montanus]|uniref:hypothetical protein n=1 Tax=Streptomyces montanus TaxID=2580423 RepID=UPI0014860FE7|nr:hypothetical protein [Streptomyces montanus]